MSRSRNACHVLASMPKLPARKALMEGDACLREETATEADQRGLLVALEMAEVLSSMRESGQQGRRGFTGPFGMKV
jgi:hypothetical protein